MDPVAGGLVQCRRAAEAGPQGHLGNLGLCFCLFHILGRLGGGLTILNRVSRGVDRAEGGLFCDGTSRNDGRGRVRAKVWGLSRFCIGERSLGRCRRFRHSGGSVRGREWPRTLLQQWSLFDFST